MADSDSTYSHSFTTQKDADLALLPDQADAMHRESLLDLQQKLNAEIDYFTKVMACARRVEVALVTVGVLFEQVGKEHIDVSGLNAVPLRLTANALPGYETLMAQIAAPDLDTLELWLLVQQEPYLDSHSLRIQEQAAQENNNMENWIHVHSTVNYEAPERKDWRKKRKENPLAQGFGGRMRQVIFWIIIAGMATIGFNYFKNRISLQIFADPPEQMHTKVYDAPVWNSTKGHESLPLQ